LSDSVPPEVVLFDVMDTLVRDPYLDALPGYFGLDADTFFRAVRPGAWVDFELGRLDEAGWFSTAFRDGRAFDGPGLRAHLAAHYRWIEGVPEVLADLRRCGRALHTLSNYPVWYRQIEARLQVSSLVEWTFVSCETGLRKPDPESYLHAARTLGIPPEACVFVDDREVNVQAARALGFHALRFVDAATLRRDLFALGTLSAGSP